MNRQNMKRTLRKLAKPVKKELFSNLEFTKDEIALMKYLYLEDINQWWVAEELGISIPTLTNWHNDCIEQVISYFNFEKYKYEHGEENNFERYFGAVKG